MQVAEMYSTADMERAARRYAEELTGSGRFAVFTLTGAISRPYGGGDGVWDFYGHAEVWHSPGKLSPITYRLTIKQGAIIEADYIWAKPIAPDPQDFETEAAFLEAEEQWERGGY